MGEAELEPTVFDQRPAAIVSNQEREAIQIDSLSLDVRLSLDTSTIEAHAILQARNTSGNPLARIPLQLSSTLHWKTISLRGRSGLQVAAFTQSPIATDTDHTGYAQEAVVSLNEKLMPGASVALTATYSGDLSPSAERLKMIGMPIESASPIEWDGINSQTVALRGFGDILWYPVAAPTASLGDGNHLFETVSRYRSRQTSTAVGLHLSVESQGRFGGSALFDGRLKALVDVDQEGGSAADEGSNLAQADFAPSKLAFESPSLFVFSQKPVPVRDPPVTIVSLEPARRVLVREALLQLSPLMDVWLGPNKESNMIVLDHPGQSFDETGLYVGPLDAARGVQGLAPQLIASFGHTRLRSQQLWVREGFPRFLGLLWIEQTQGREAALAQLNESATLIALSERDMLTSVAGDVAGPLSQGEPLISTGSDIFFRTKAAAVWWQLRDIVGERLLQLAMQKYVAQSSNQGFDSDAFSFQHVLESVAKRDLAWFFDDWVYHDRSLPDLSIVSVTPRALPATRGRTPGYLIAVEVRNDGAAVAEVPVLVRSGELLASERLRVPAHGSASTRIVFEGVAETVQVNDGSVPELATSVHRVAIHLPVTP